MRNASFYSVEKIVEKVKDIVDVHKFEHVRDFVLDPGKTLSGYRFTDITADLMSKWISAIGSVRKGAGVANAIAGYRGVGKSHLLAALMGILTRPEMRAGIGDPLVRSTAESLSRRHFNVYFVQRGTGVSLIDEIRAAVSANTGISPDTLSNSLNDLLLKAVGTGDTPTVIFVDTAPTRLERVSRDDGQVLSDMAETAKGLGIFIGVALDDDISGADGVNASIVRSYAIDYLDQEHLYKIVDSHIFTKNPAKLAVLKQIYSFYRETMPSFRWSERRFSSLYPMHPATLEIAPLIRLFVHDFALLSFASDAGVRILGRPANSLIGLDEMFDNVEARLRQIQAIHRGVETYDRLDREVIGALPVNSRLYAKMILKGLFLYSLDGRGATGSDISASMLISVEDERSAELTVEDVLIRFAAVAGEEVKQTLADDGSKCFAIKIEAGDGASDAVEAAARDVPSEVLRNVLVSLLSDKFGDLTVDVESGSPSTGSVEWRGTVRRGIIDWYSTGNDRTDLDWMINVKWPSELLSTEPTIPTDSIEWVIATPTPNEVEVLRRYHILHNDISLRDQVTEGLATALHSNTIAAGKVLHRIFFEEAKLVCDTTEYELSDDASLSYSLSQVLTESVGPIFDKRYPDHPTFNTILDAKKAASIIERFFSSENEGINDDSLAEQFIVPLGIGEMESGRVVRVKEAEGPISHAIGAILSAVDGSATRAIEVEVAEGMLAARPFGLSREARQLVLAHLVADRGCDFVTHAGNRISSRSLHLQIVWDDIYGIARSLHEKRSTSRLLEWAKVITGDASLTTLDTPDGRKAVSVAISHWLKQWKGREVFNRFDNLPDEHQTTFVWRSASNVRKTFGSAAEILADAVKDADKLIDAMTKVAVLFSDNEEEFERRATELNNIERYFANAERVSVVDRAVSSLLPVKDQALESARARLCSKLNDGVNLLLDKGVDNILQEWSHFTECYRAYYFQLHDRSIRTDSGDLIISEMLSSRSWTEFENLATDPVHEVSIDTAKESVVKISRLKCDRTMESADAIAITCECGASINDLEDAVSAYEDLKILVGETLALGRRSGSANVEPLARFRSSQSVIQVE